ncbi:MAG: hypothetical protein RI947_436 [Candidatus Parcubacteria bacterium]
MGKVPVPPVGNGDAKKLVGIPHELHNGQELFTAHRSAVVQPTDLEGVHVDLAINAIPVVGYFHRRGALCPRHVGTHRYIAVKVTEMSDNTVPARTDGTRLVATKEVYGAHAVRGGCFVETNIAGERIGASWLHIGSETLKCRDDMQGRRSALGSS